MGDKVVGALKLVGQRPECFRFFPAVCQRCHVCRKGQGGKGQQRGTLLPLARRAIRDVSVQRTAIPCVLCGLFLDIFVNNYLLKWFSIKNRIHILCECKNLLRCALHQRSKSNTGKFINIKIYMKFCIMRRISKFCKRMLIFRN